MCEYVTAGACATLIHCAKFARMGQATQILDLVGINAICEQITAGATYTEIARVLGVGYATLWNWINSDAERADKSARARTASAEAWLDRGIVPLESALRLNNGVDATAARAYAQECARRAAIRNPKFSDKIVHAGDADNPLQVQHSVAAPQITREEWLRLHGIGADVPRAPVALPVPLAQRVGNSEKE